MLLFLITLINLSFAPQILSLRNRWSSSIFGSSSIIQKQRSQVCTRIQSTSSSTTASLPSTFLDCVRQATFAAKAALADGAKLIEIEFPPLPLQLLEDSSSSARAIADANTRWAIEFAQAFSSEGKVSIVYPDQPELDDAVRYVDMEGGANPYPNVTLATIRSDSIRNAGTIDQIITSIFGATVAGTVTAVEKTSIYVALISSTQELPDLEKLHSINPDIPIVFFNLRLDVLRGDLGLPLFPGRDLHHRFLSKVKPAFYIKNRSFATSLRKPPFLVNYSGVLYRNYPAPFQSILNTGSNKSKVVKSSPERPTNMDFKDSLTAALQIKGVSQDELKTGGNLVWWEKELDKEQSSNWRS